VSDATGLGQHAILEHYNGRSWSVTQAPDLSASYPINAFNAVLAITLAARAGSLCPPAGQAATA